MTKYAYCDNVSPSFKEKIGKLNLEAAEEGERWFRERRKISFGSVLFKSKLIFLKTFFLQGTLKKGYDGFTEALNHALYQLFSYARYWELTERERGKM